MGALRLEQGNARGALESLAAARALAPSDTAVYRDMAQAYYALGAPAEAAEVWRGAVAAVPGSGEAFLNVAVLAREAGRHGWAEAERAYRAVMRLDDGVPLGAVSVGPARPLRVLCSADEAPLPSPKTEPNPLTTPRGRIGARALLVRESLVRRGSLGGGGTGVPRGAAARRGA
jgi:tetratricopeptide (TPR) repeat protein